MDEVLNLGLERSPFTAAPAPSTEPPAEIRA
jgi:hypothetical protein